MKQNTTSQSSGRTPCPWKVALQFGAGDPMEGPGTTDEICPGKGKFNLECKLQKHQKFWIVQLLKEKNIKT